MKNLKEYLFDRECDNIILTEAASIIGEEMINEAFKSKILGKLASTIKEYEKEQHRNDIEKQNDYNDKGWGKINPSEKTFTSLFGPIVQTSRYGSSTKKVRGCQWDKITDDNITYYEGGYDSALHKKIKQLYASKIRGLLIVCDPETHDIVYAVRGYSENDDKTRKPKKPSTFEFKAWTTTNGKSHKRVVNKTAPIRKGGWQRGDLKVDALIELINDYDVYFVEIPNEYITDYDVLVKDREEAQKGVINYDDASLKELAQRQRLHYKVLAKELRAKRLQDNPKYMLNEITKIHNEALKLAEQIIDNKEHIDEGYSIGNAMSYITSAFEEYFKYLKSMKDAEASVERAHIRGYEEPESYGEHYRSDAASKLDNCKDRLERAKNYLDEIRERIAE